MLYYCNACIICTPNLSDYNKHIQTKKHIKKTTTNTVSSIYDSNECNVNLNISDIQFNIANDRNVKKNFNKDQRCKYCGVCYSYSSGLSRHIKECKSRVTVEDNNTSSNATVENIKITDMNSVINKLFEENAEFKKLIIDSMKSNQDTTNKVLELCKSNPASVTNNIYNHQGDNNHFSINVFLNEKCKDAMNMTDFVNSIEVTNDDMEYVGERGYVEGISSIFIDNLKNTEINKRPIHCSDRKRHILYVKESDKWERDEVNSDVLKKAVLVVEQKNIKKVNEWANEHPECYNSYNRANDIYLKLSKGATDGNEEKILTIVKNIAKETVINKDAMM